MSEPLAGELLLLVANLKAERDETLKVMRKACEASCGCFSNTKEGWHGEGCWKGELLAVLAKLDGKP